MWLFLEIKLQSLYYMDAIQSESTVKSNEIYFNSLIDGDVICPQFQVNVNFVYILFYIWNAKLACNTPMDVIFIVLSINVKNFS